MLLFYLRSHADFILSQFSKQNKEIYRGYNVIFTIINKILFIILIAWRKRSIIDLNVKSVRKIIDS